MIEHFIFLMKNQKFPEKKTPGIREKNPKNALKN